MKVEKEALDELYKIWLEENPGQHLSQQELLDMAERLLTLTQIVYRQIPQKDSN